MLKAKLAIGFILVIIVTLGYCGSAGAAARWGLPALVLFVISFLGLLLTGMFAFFDWIFRSRKE